MMATCAGVYAARPNPALRHLVRVLEALEAEPRFGRAMPDTVPALLDGHLVHLGAGEQVVVAAAPHAALLEVH